MFLPGPLLFAQIFGLSRFRLLYTMAPTSKTMYRETHSRRRPARGKPSENRERVAPILLRRLGFVAAWAALMFVSGCGAAHRLHADYTNYEAVYADTSNREMLLNLARLDQHDPTFFFKMGQIGTSYQMSAGLSGSGNYMIQGTGSGGNAIGGGTPTLAYQKTPTFQFIPVDDNTTAQFLLKPVDPLIFYNLYQQGWRVDQLLRLMVDHIEFRQPNSKYWEVIRNTPTPENAENYARFLRVAAMSYDLQRLGYLRLQGRQTFAPIGSPIPLDTPPAAAKQADQSAAAGGTAAAANPPAAAPKASSSAAPEAKDFLDAQDKNIVWKQVKDGWQMEQTNIIGLFSLNAPQTALELEDAAEVAAVANNTGTAKADLAGVPFAQAAASADAADAAAQAAAAHPGSAALADAALADATAAAKDADTALAAASALPSTTPNDARFKTLVSAADTAAKNALDAAKSADDAAKSSDSMAGDTTAAKAAADASVRAADAAAAQADDNSATMVREALIEQFETDMPELKGGGMGGQRIQDVFLQILKDGFTVEDSFNTTDVTDEPNKFACKVVLRSLIGVMAAAAQEQDEFAQLISKNPTILVDPREGPGGPTTMKFTELVPKVEMQPILRLKWTSADQINPPLAQLSYGTGVYVVSDPCVAPADTSVTTAPSKCVSAPVDASVQNKADPPLTADWNRDVFRLISQLAAQVTVDISKFPLPAILQLSTQ
jgi:hypothetical protein